MASTLWIEPRERSLSGRIELDRLEEELLGKYIRQPVEAGAPIVRANVMPWPDLPDEDVVTVTLEGEPDWLMLNQGSTVEVWIGQKAATPRYALVQAIVASDNKWIALLRAPQSIAWWPFPTIASWRATCYALAGDSNVTPVQGWASRPQHPTFPQASPRCQRPASETLVTSLHHFEAPHAWWPTTAPRQDPMLSDCHVAPAPTPSMPAFTASRHRIIE
jgi:hypothetical protein